ncbi:MAG: hypothetical protein Q8755_03035, partial [Candidatus Phytoplasma australasiaticum]|nr:hypothetical protein [Candidatus Phytoplasma australasiaticum]
MLENLTSCVYTEIRKYGVLNDWIHALYISQIEPQNIKEALLKTTDTFRIAQKEISLDLNY